MPIAMAQTVIYSMRLTRFLVSQIASVTRSIPSTKIRAPTTQTAGSAASSAWARKHAIVRIKPTQVADDRWSDGHNNGRSSGQHQA